MSGKSGEANLLEYTPILEIKGGVDKLRLSFRETRKTHDVQYRLNALRSLYFALKDYSDAFCEALSMDFGRLPSETKTLEIAVVLNEIVTTMASLHKWMKPDKVEEYPANMAMAALSIEKIPLGVVLVISPFNYPLVLSVSPIVGALAAGNCVVLKLSESTPRFSALLSRVLSSCLDDDVFYVVNGAVEETTEVLDQKFDKIMYTGNPTVGRIVAKKAAETLTPVILELGGKSPAFVLSDVKSKDISTIARRIVWGRFTNGGQTCVAIDYVLAHALIKDQLVKEIARVVTEEFYPEDSEITHVIHDRAFKGLTKMIDATKGDIVAGGTSNADKRYIAPTVIDNVTWDDLTMAAEIFGPVLPIISYTDLQEAVNSLLDRHDTPLAEYVFTSGPLSRAKNSQIDMIARSVRSGALVVNDSIMQAGLSGAPFGGVGESGYGAYHGYYLFKQFSHERTIIGTPLWAESLLKARYPPIKAIKDKIVGIALTAYGGHVWFDRTGNVPVRGPSTIFGAWATLAGAGAMLYYMIAA